MPLTSYVLSIIAYDKNEKMGLKIEKGRQLGRCKLWWLTFCDLMDFLQSAIYSMPQTHCKIINLTKIFMDYNCQLE